MLRDAGGSRRSAVAFDELLDALADRPVARRVLQPGGAIGGPAFVELLGGLFCLIGFLTRWAAFGLGALMLWQIIQYHGFYVFYRENHQLPFALFIMAFASFGLGGGKYSLDEKQKKKDG